MSEGDALRQRNAARAQLRAQLEAAWARRVFPTTADGGERTDDPDHLAGKALVAISYVVAALVLMAAANSGDGQLAVVGIEIVVGLLLLTNAWGLRSRLPLVNSSSRSVVVIGWIAILLVAIALYQVAALCS